MSDLYRQEMLRTREVNKRNAAQHQARSSGASSGMFGGVEGMRADAMAPLQPIRGLAGSSLPSSSAALSRPFFGSPDSPAGIDDYDSDIASQLLAPSGINQGRASGSSRMAGPAASPPAAGVMSVVSSLSGPRGFMVQLLVVFVIVFVIALLASLWDGSSSSSLPAPGVPGAVYSGQAVIEHDPVAQQAVRLLRTALQKVRGSPYEQDRTAAVHLVQWTDWRSEDLEDVLLTTRTLQLLHQSAGAADLTSGSGGNHAPHRHSQHQQQHQQQHRHRRHQRHEPHQEPTPRGQWAPRYYQPAAERHHWSRKIAHIDQMLAGTSTM